MEGEQHQQVTQSIIVSNSGPDRVILYNSETWSLREEQKRKLRVFEMSLLMV